MMMTRSRKKRKRRALTRHLLPLRTIRFFFLKMFVRLRGSETRPGLEALVGRYVEERQARGVNPWSEGESMRRFMTRLWNLAKLFDAWFQWEFHRLLNGDRMELLIEDLVEMGEGGRDVKRVINFASCWSSKGRFWRRSEAIESIEIGG